MRVKELLSWPVASCQPDDSLDKAARLMWEHDCGTVPVVDDMRVVIGMVTDRDICMASYLQGMPLRAIRVSDIMARQIHACRPDDTVDAAEEIMSEKQVRRLPVVDANGRLVGMVSLSDIARWIASSRRRDGSQGRFLRTLATISRPRMAKIATLPAALPTAHA